MFTTGQTIYPGMQVSLWYNPDEKFNLPMTYPRYRLILIETGTGILYSKGTPTKFLMMGPALLCLNELDTPVIEWSDNYRAHATYFDPSFINNAFTFENLRLGSDDFSLTEIRDSHWLRPFFHRDSKYGGYLKIGPVTARRVFELLQQIENELCNQPDDYWPCRSRSFLLELLFLIERVYMKPEFSEIIQDFPDEMKDMILFLHTHYQEKVTIAELTEVFHLNRTSLEERFHRVTGMSIVSYLIQLRMQLAALMLRDSMIPVAEIMERVGYSDYAHFGRMFHKYFRCSPQEYRECYCWLIGRTN